MEKIKKQPFYRTKKANLAAGFDLCAMALTFEL
jgi:hypothetical protein